MGSEVKAIATFCGVPAASVRAELRVERAQIRSEIKAAASCSTRLRRERLQKGKG